MKTLAIFDQLRGRLYPDRPELGDMPMYLLVYLVFLWMPVAVGESMSYSMTWLSLGLFLPLYFLRWQERQLLLISIAMWLLWLVFARYNWGAQTYAVYACATAGAIISSRKALLTFAFMLVGSCAYFIHHQVPMGFVLAPFAMGAIVFISVRLDNENSRRDALLRLSQNEISKLAERNERERIARDVHDLLGHSLTLIALKADLANRLISKDPAAAAAELAQIKTVARDSLSEVRQAVHGMRAAQVSVEVAKSRLACDVANIQLITEIDERLIIPRAIEDVLASVLREAVNNVVRHSKADQLRVELRGDLGGDLSGDLSGDGNGVSLLIQDNGKLRQLKEGHGMSSMRERVAQINGKFDYQIQDGLKIRVAVKFGGKKSASHQQPQVAQSAVGQHQPQVAQSAIGQACEHLI